MRVSLPAFAQVITRCHETGHPDASSRVGIERERSGAQAACACNHRGEVSNSDDEIAEEQRPLAETLEPSLRFRHMTADIPLQQRKPLQSVTDTAARGCICPR